jgi:hypothetical protein
MRLPMHGAGQELMPVAQQMDHLSLEAELPCSSPHHELATQGHSLARSSCQFGRAETHRSNEHWPDEC